MLLWQIQKMSLKRPQRKLELVITSSIKHSPDLVVWPVHEKKKYLWNIGGVKGYGSQTSAREMHAFVCG